MCAISHGTGPAAAKADEIEVRKFGPGSSGGSDRELRARDYGALHCFRANSARRCVASGFVESMASSLSASMKTMPSSPRNTGACSPGSPDWSSDRTRRHRPRVPFGPLPIFRWKAHRRLHRRRSTGRAVRPYPEAVHSEDRGNRHWLPRRRVRARSLHERRPR